MPLDRLEAVVRSELLGLALRLHVVLVFPGPHEQPALAERAAVRAAEALAAAQLGEQVAVTVTVDSPLGGCTSVDAPLHGSSAAPPSQAWPCGLTLVEWGGLSDRAVDAELQVRPFLCLLAHLWVCPMAEPCCGLRVQERLGASLQAGAYALVLLPAEHIGDTGLVTGTHRHAWARLGVLGTDMERLLSAVGDGAVEAARTFGLSIHGSTPEPPPISAEGTLRLEFALCNAAPVARHHFTWDFAAAVPALVAPLVEALAPLAAVRVGSSVRLHTPPGGVDAASPPEWDPALAAFLWPPHRLHQLVDPQWGLHAPASQPHERVLQFVVYVPPQEHCPLALAGGGSVGFTSPHWGGLVLWNPPGCGAHNSSNAADAPHSVSPQQLRALLGVMVAQLRRLLGLPPVPHGSVLLATASGIAAWEVDLLTRRATAAHSMGAQQSLSSLGRVIGSLPNMVISDTISQLAADSLDALAAAKQAAALGAHAEAARLAVSAHSAAERAFFHPTILSLLYFPSDHKLAVYLPLFLPALLPLLLTAMREARHYRKRRAHSAAWHAQQREDKGQ